MIYNTVHSLGSRCQNSEILKLFNYREFSGFFDFMNTFSIGNINHILKDDFKELLKKDNNNVLKCEQPTVEPETGIMLHSSYRTANKFYNLDYTNVHTAIFPHHNLNEEKDRLHFETCYLRFKKLKHFNTLFNYTFNLWENKPSKDELESMIKSLEEVHGFSNFRVCFIALSLSNESKYKKILEEKKYDVWHLVIQHSSFTGGLFNYGLDNQNYIDIIKSYHISDTRVTKEEIDSFSI